MHYTKKDWWLVATALLAVLIPLILGAFFSLSEPREKGSLLIVIGIVIGGVLLLLTYPLYYRITSSGVDCSLWGSDA